MLNQKNLKYITGISWFILSLVISNLNDVLTKYLGMSLPFAQVAFMRFLFGCISLLPFMVYFGASSFKTSKPSVHIIRGALLFLAINIWCFGLNVVPIASATLLTFTIPFFVLIMAPMFLNERVSPGLWSVTIAGFIGVYIVLWPDSKDFNPYSLLMMVSALLFAALDIINKKFIIKETMLSMLFYSALVTTVLSSVPAYYHWQEINGKQAFLLFLLGAGSNLILFCILKGFALVRASDVAPYRYLELVLSAATGFIVFSEAPTLNMLVGALIIIPTTLYIGYSRASS